MSPTPSPLRALDLILGEPWAIQPPALEQILGIAQRLNDAPEAVAARLGRPLQNTRTVTERQGAAVIPITGPIFRRANLFTEISGATSVEVLATDIQAAIDNPAIERLILEIDSPGGQATGIAELAAMIHASPKTITAYIDGMAASAAYWLASAAHQTVIASTGLVGSIGVILSYRPEKDAPIKIVSSQSPLKQADPQTDTGRAELQRVVDQLAAVFVADVARYRRTTPETVTGTFGRGGLLVGQHAANAGMVDRLGTLESTLASLAPTPTAGRPSALVTPRPLEASMRPIPNPHPPTADPRAIWSASPALQAEFGDFDRWQAFERATLSGRGRISNPVTKRVEHP